MKTYTYTNGNVSREVTGEQLFILLSNEYTKIISRDELDFYDFTWDNGKGSRLINLPYSVIYASGKQNLYNTTEDVSVPENILFDFMKDKPVTKSNKIIGIFLYNIKKKDDVSRNINEIIKKLILENNCVVCGSGSDLVCDHKNDLYNDTRLNNVKKQRITDFQCLCNHCNLQKRQICKNERKNKKLYSAKNIPQFAIYDFVFPWELKVFNENEISCKENTYWFDPIQFNFNINCYSKYVLPLVKAIKKQVPLIK
jgi:hypothetical protein